MTLEVVRYRDVIDIVSVKGVVPGSTPPEIEVTGEDFTAASAVYINDIRVTKFRIPDKNTLIAEIPSGQENDLRFMEVLSSRLTKTNPRARVSFGIGPMPACISGIFGLTQLFMKWLLQDPNSDIFHPTRGGGLQEIVGEAVGTQNMDVVTSALTQAISRTTEQILVSQAQTGGLAADERLLDATLINLQRNDELLEVSARIQVTSMAGNEAISSLIL